MAVKRYKPTSPARRFMTVNAYSELSGDKPEKSLLHDKRKTGGRNNMGRITVRHIGGGNKIKYRVIDFKRNKDGIPATVKSIQYDPNRSAHIALLAYADGEKRYILAPVGLNVGDKVLSGAGAREHLIAYVQAYGREDVPLFAVCICKKRDVRRTVGVVLNGLNRCGDAVFVALEIYYPVFDLVAAADVANGYPAHVVSAAGLALIVQEALLGFVARKLAVSVYGHEAAGGRCGLISLNCHFSCPPLRQ